MKIILNVETLSVLVGAIAEYTMVPKPNEAELAVEAILEDWARRMQAKMWVDEKHDYKVKFDDPLAMAMLHLLTSYNFADTYMYVQAVDLIAQLEKVKATRQARNRNRYKQLHA